MKMKTFTNGMIRNELLLIALIVALACPTIAAQHYVGAMIDGGAAWHLYREDNITLNHNSLAQPKIGASGSIGGVYQFQHNEFLLQTGLSLSEVWVRQMVDTMFIKNAMQDSEGYDFTYCGEVYDRVDYALLTELDVPLLLGAQVGSFHVLAGVKCAVTVYGVSVQEALLTTHGDYGDRYYGVLENMPQHGFFEARELAARDSLMFRPDVRLCLELGWTCALTKSYTKKRSPKLQLGAYLEYGVGNPLNLSKNTDAYFGASYYPDMNVNLNPIGSALSREYSALNNLRVGIRATVLFPMKAKSTIGKRRY
jgi:hypothetical protein